MHAFVCTFNEQKGVANPPVVEIICYRNQENDHYNKSDEGKSQNARISHTHTHAHTHILVSLVGGAEYAFEAPTQYFTLHTHTQYTHTHIDFATLFC